MECIDRLLLFVKCDTGNFLKLIVKYLKKSQRKREISVQVFCYIPIETVMAQFDNVYKHEGCCSNPTGRNDYVFGV